MPERYRYMLLVSILLLAFFLRINKLADWAVWWDEAWSVWVAQQPFTEATEITARDIHPPIYQWALFVWVRLTGSSEFSVRLLSVFAGLITVTTVYPLTIRLSRHRLAACIALIFISLSTFHIHWSQETRMYALAAMFTALSAYAYLRLDHSWSLWWFLLVVSGVGVSLSHYLGVFSLVIINLHVLIHWRKFDDKRRKWLIAMGVIGLIWLLWAFYAIGLIRTDGGPAQFDPIFAFQILATLFAVGQSTNLDAYVLPAILLTLIYLIGLAQFWHVDRRSSLFILIASLLPPLIITLLSVPFNPFYAPAPEERYFIIFAPIVFAGLGISLTLWFRPVGIVIFVGMVIIYAMGVFEHNDERYFKDDYASMMAAVSIVTQPDDPIFFTSGGRYPLIYYNLERYASYEGATITGIASVTDDVPGMMAATFADVSRFWLIEIEAHLDEPEGARLAWINAHYERVYHVAVGHNGLSLYSKDENDRLSTLPDGKSPGIVPPVITEARPGDVVRIGAPAHTPVTLVYDGHIIETQQADTWQLLQFLVYPAYPEGLYTLQIDDKNYPFMVTHSQNVPDNVPDNVNVFFGDMLLSGYMLDQSANRLDLTLYWRADDRPDKNYTVFAQLIGPFNPATDGPLWTQLDSYPADTPTQHWWPGLVAYDKRTLTIPSSAPDGDYLIIVGLYDLNTGERLLTADGQDHVVVSQIEVKDD